MNMIRNLVVLVAGVISAASLAATQIATPSMDPSMSDESAMSSEMMAPEAPPLASDELLQDDPPAAGKVTFTAQGTTFSAQACAKEGGSCMLLTRTAVAYGAAGSFAVRTFAAGTVACSNATFGDPKFGVVKACFVATAGTTSAGATASGEPPTGFQTTACAREGGSCSVSSPTQVAYGAAGGFVVKTFNAGTFGCSNAAFGDPKMGVAKACYLGPAGTAQAATMPPPAAATSPTTAFTGNAVVTITPALAEASRFLVQATYGPNLAEIDALSKSTPSQWIDRQFATPPMDTHWAYVMERKGPVGCNPCDAEWINAVMESFWLQAVRGPDQLRQRVVFALSQLFVVSTVNSPVEIQKDAHAAYLDMLSRNAFGNYRTLLEEVSTHPTMATYLSSFKNDKEDPATGRLPDENYAREVMQLFTIGLWQLNPDGTRKKDANGNDIPTYTQADVMGMAKVFTGWGWGGKGTTEGDWHGWTGNAAWDKRLISYPQHHSSSEKRIVGGVVIPANTPGPQSLKIALDTLFNHPNMGPMFGTHLIKRFVTSNPSPAYVARVTAAFNNNGQGVRGDMKAVIRAVLLDPDARDVAKASDPNWGKMREPMIRYANFMRAFDVQAPSGKYKIWNLENPVSSIGQNPLRAPSVFNWYTANYAPPGDIMTKGMVAPEFAITHETTATGYTNFMVGTAERQSAWWRENVAKKWGPITDYLGGDYAAEMSLAGNPSAMIDRLNLILAQGRMSAATKKTIVDALNTIPASTDSGHRRVAAAVALTLVSPDFIVQK